MVQVQGYNVRMILVSGAVSVTVCLLGHIIEDVVSYWTFISSVSWTTKMQEISVSAKTIILMVPWLHLPFGICVGFVLMGISRRRYSFNPGRFILIGVVAGSLYSVFLGTLKGGWRPSLLGSFIGGGAAGCCVGAAVASISTLAHSLGTLKRLRLYIITGLVLGLFYSGFIWFNTGGWGPPILPSLAIGGITGSLAGFLEDRRWSKRFPGDCCQHCGYNNTGNTTSLCPECGNEATHCAGEL